MFRSLRWRLVFSYVGLIFLCLLLAGSTVVIVLRDYQERVRLDRLADLAVPISINVAMMERNGAALPSIVEQLRAASDALGVRIILADRQGLVLEDTGGGFDGQHIELPTADTPERRSGPAPYYSSNEHGLFMIAPRVGPRSNYAVIVAVPQASVAQAWLELAPSLFLAAAISLVVSVLVALVMTRTITRPLLRMTRASEEMARGRYDQAIPVHGRDEVARLASAFNEMAQQVSTSDKTMRDFLANVSHELKTPLTSIQGFSQAMLDGTIDSAEEYQGAAAVISDEASRMRRMVEDLLTLSKIESGQIAMGDEVVQLDELLRDAMRRTEWHAESAGVGVQLDARSGALVRGDAHWLGQVFSNLLDNAFEHTPSSGRITVRAQPVARAGAAVDQVLVTVHNTGSYIPPDDLPRVFERFFQGDRSRAKRGSGIGLAIVREVVQAHGGSVEAASDPVHGTTFSVRLPMHSMADRPPIPFPSTRVA